MTFGEETANIEVEFIERQIELSQKAGYITQGLLSIRTSITFAANVLLKWASGPRTVKSCRLKSVKT